METAVSPKPPPAVSSSRIIRSPAKASTDESLCGINGWLILPAIQLVGGMVWLIVAIVIDLVMAGSSGPGDRLHSVLLIEAFMNAVMLAFVGYVSVAFFSCKRVVPKLMIALYSARVVVQLIDDIFVGVATDHLASFENVFISCIFAAIWIPYFLVSQRVKATFTVDSPKENDLMTNKNRA